MQSQVITKARFSVGQQVKLNPALSEVHVVVFREGRHQQYVVDSATLVEYLRRGVCVLGVQELDNPLPNLASEAASDCHHKVCFGHVPSHGTLYFPEWQFEPGGSSRSAL